MLTSTPWIRSSGRVGKMAPPVGADRVEKKVGSARSPKGVWLDEPMPSLGAEIDEQTVDGSKPDGLDAAAQSGGPEGRWIDRGFC